MYVTIAYNPDSYSDDLIYAADYSISLSFEDYYNWSSQELKNKYPFPKPYKMALQFVTKPPTPCDDAHLLKQGKVNDDTVKLFQKENEFILYFPNITNGTSDLSCDSEEKLELYYSLKYGKKIEWD
ncbi:MAG: hypothetical protein F6K23_26915 [Okeania sp. SIO2C9]|uniref:hypothetical protein n=1 Tax=Okeania sp. SIO2C9 TaxID=2607791 RepID=UPI0013BF8512|nr:hypothetical protein [Okeania sp. SIO2C9]NEQ76351.1 hypothetical protein [Okeania sp. SIO2C9]